MTITLTSLTKRQWGKFAKVFVWVVVTNGIGVLIAYLASNAHYLVLGPTLNVALVGLQQIATQEEDKSVEGLPVADKTVVAEADATLESVLPEAQPPVPPTE